MTLLAHPTHPAPLVRDIGWRRGAEAGRGGWRRVSLAVVLVEAVVGLWQGLAVGSVR